MFNLTNEMASYQTFIQRNLQNLSDIQIIFLMAWCVNGLLSLPNALIHIQKSLDISDTKEKIVESILQSNISLYQEKLRHLLSKMNEYSSDCVEPEVHGTYSLAGFNSALNSAVDKEGAAYALEVVIDLIDYYGQTDDYQLWSRILQKELDAQRSIITDLLNGKPVTINSYQDFLMK